jgi:hypothetical protein
MLEKCGNAAASPSASSGEAADRRARNQREESAGQALPVLQHEALVGRIAEEFFHRRANSNVLGKRQSSRYRRRIAAGGTIFRSGVNVAGPARDRRVGGGLSALQQKENVKR